MGELTSLDVKEKAHEIGFDLCGVAPVGDFPELTFFQKWLARGYAGEMDYLRRSADRRADVRHVLPSARSVVVTGTIYNTDVAYSTEHADSDRALIARYAWGDDYHDVLGHRLQTLLAWMRERSAQPFEARAYVDTGPVQERVYAQYAGLGWIGKNTCVINPEVGSWLFLAEILCSLPLQPDAPAFDQCGECSLCIEACPTGAITGPGVLDATRCISYLTIERRGPIPEEFARAVGSHVFGCDVCQEVCPWNHTAPRSTDAAWQRRAVWAEPPLATLSRMADGELRAAMRGSAMRRTKISGLRRNLAVACGNRESAKQGS